MLAACCLFACLLFAWRRRGKTIDTQQNLACCLLMVTQVAVVIIMMVVFVAVKAGKDALIEGESECVRVCRFGGKVVVRV